MNRMVILGFLLAFISCTGQNTVFDGERAFVYLEEQCAIGYRYPGSAGHQKALQYYRNFFSDLADTLILQSFTQSIPEEDVSFKLTNIIAGFNINRPNPLLIGAHWDTRPRADHDPNPQKRSSPILGANDGASGVAVLMHLAELIHTNKPERAIFLVFFDGEDYGYSGTLEYYCMGSEYFAKNLPIIRPAEAIIIDMIGDRELEIPMERYSYQSHPRLVKTLWEIARKRGFTEFQHKFGSYIYDDHVMLIEHAGIPSVDIIDFDYPNRYQNFWHTTMDTPDKCSPRSLQIVGQVLYDYIYSREITKQ
ncbi:MAG TPA: M28 family peptidase [Candidatus Marinimicrobia bacterium]|nr:M28 family peptidase [Candidatus Neomarinimicrobiota bacterium]